MLLLVGAGLCAMRRRRGVSHPARSGRNSFGGYTHEHDQPRRGPPLALGGGFGLRRQPCVGDNAFPMHGTSTVRVLLVEDHALLAAEMTRLLERAHCVVLGPAASVRETLALLEDGARPDLALVDRSLPDGDGLTILPALAARGIERVVLSAHSRPPHLTGAMASAAWMEKPVDVPRLLARIEELRARVRG